MKTMLYISRDIQRGAPSTYQIVEDDEPLVLTGAAGRIAALWADAPGPAQSNRIIHAVALRLLTNAREASDRELARRFVQYIEDQHWRESDRVAKACVYQLLNGYD